MKSLRFLLVFICVAVLTSCASAPSSRTISVTKEISRLNKITQGRKVAFLTKYTDYDIHGEEIKGACNIIKDEAPLEKSVMQWAPNRVDQSALTANDLLISYSLVCKDIYTDKTGGTATLAVFTLGVVPAVNRYKIDLYVDAYIGNKKVFSEKYNKTEEFNSNLWNYSNSLKEHVVNIANYLVDDFTKELEGSGALEK